ncbi:MAG: prepilin-type N-terminal cleavage/methylation domain-containing protein [Casimicrobiaceae bacterium]|nr:prepilin-type N-terminal cleavage/methylation domain-containing protein [Casimicrobiaceae bacterium]
MASDRFSRRLRGLTLIELMIIVAVVAILAAIAYPSYREQTLRGFRAECKSAVMNVLQAQERYYGSRNTYTTNLAAVGVNAFSGDNLSASACDLSARPCGSEPLTACIEIVATSRKSDTACNEITRDSRGNRGGTNVSLCWR